MTQAEYLRYLLTPEWKAKRKEVYARDSYTCQKCNRTNCEIHAHHIRYPVGKKPWECPLEDLITWCKRCHNYFHEETVKVHAAALLDEIAIEQLKQDGFDAESWETAVETELENILLQIFAAERDKKVADLEERGAQWENDGQFYGLDGKCYGIDGELM